MPAPGDAELVASTLKRRSGKILDAVLKTNALYNRLSQKGRIRPVDGGLSITENIEYAENPNFNWYSGYDQLPLSPSDVISTAEWDWKQCACPVVISGREQLQNSGTNKVFDLLEAKLRNAETTMKNGLNVALLADGTGSGGKVLTGLDAALPQDNTVGTYGGINRALWPFWRHKVRDTATPITATNILGEFGALWVDTVRGGDRADLIMAGSTIWAALEAAVMPLVRFTADETARVGFPSIRYKDSDVVVETGMVATDAFFLNTDYISLRPHRNRNMVPLDPKRRWSVNQDAEAQILAWAGNLTVIPTFQGRLKGD
jgi:hypothetical protein